MKINKVYNGDFLNNTLADSSVNLIIADPPYFEVKGEFDFSFESFESYLQHVEKWAQEFKRILADNGTLLYWGNSKKIAYSQIILDKYFNLLNSCVWEKYDSILSCQEVSRCLRQHNERLLIYDKNIDTTGLEKIYIDKQNFLSIRKYFQDERQKTNLTYKQINEECFGSASNGGGMASNILTSYKKGWNFPTKEKYKALQKIGICKKPYEELRQEYEELRQEYEELRQEYEELRRPFNNVLKLEEVLKYSQQSNVTKKYEHPTKKPERLTRDLIECCSKVNDLVFVPFAGSGTECAMSRRSKRNFIGFDICKEYVNMSNKRVQYIEKTPTLF